MMMNHLTSTDLDRSRVEYDSVLFRWNSKYQYRLTGTIRHA